MLTQFNIGKFECKIVDDESWVFIGTEEIYYYSRKIKSDEVYDEYLVKMKNRCYNFIRKYCTDISNKCWKKEIMGTIGQPD